MELSAAFRCLSNLVHSGYLKLLQRAQTALSTSKAKTSPHSSKLLLNLAQTTLALVKLPKLDLTKGRVPFVSRLAKLIDPMARDLALCLRLYEEPFTGEGDFSSLH